MEITLTQGDWALLPCSKFSTVEIDKQTIMYNSLCTFPMIENESYCINFEPMTSISWLGQVKQSGKTESCYVRAICWWFQERRIKAS